MIMFLTPWRTAICAVLFVFTIPAQAQQLGWDYSEIAPALVSDNQDKIEVIEFFSYACPHCNELNSTLKLWTAKLPGDVSFRKIAVGFGNPFYQMMAKLFYALEAMGESKRIEDAVFEAIHSKGVKFSDEMKISSWVATQGVDGKEFSANFRSFAVSSQAKRADMLVGKANIQGVPSVLIDGRYLVGGPNIKSPADILSVADKLIAKARLERRAKI